jgi:dephospho-CoA kinase
MKNIGLTGGIGSGKTTVSTLLINNGIPVYDSDSRAKFIMNNSFEIKKKIINYFGKESYKDDFLNKKHISQLVFNDKIALNEINSIVHPFVEKDFIKWRKMNFYKYVIYESAIVFESGSYKNNDYNILVTSNVNERIKRVVNRDKVSEKDVMIRINNQWEDEKKILLADYIIKNDSITKINQSVLDLIYTLNKFFK